METISIVYHDALQLFLYLLAAHLIGDFLLQSKKLITWKKKAKKGILVHVLIHLITTLILVSPFILMSGGSALDPLIMCLGVVGIIGLHFIIDMEKIKFEKKKPDSSFQIYLVDQLCHVGVIAVFTILLQDFASVRFENEILGDIYFAKEILLYLILLISVTYTWEITTYEYARRSSNKPLPFVPSRTQMMVRGIIISVIFVLLTPLTAYAVNPKYSSSIAPDGRIDDVEPNQFSFGDEVVITGNGFGDEMTEFSQVCWGKLCVNRGSITQWTDDEIRFTMNVLGMPSQGLLHVVKTNSSGLYTEDINGEGVMVLPTIEALYDEQGNRLFSLTAGQTVTVEGYYFGNTMGTIQLDNTFVSQIQPWTESQITFIVPELLEKTNTLTIQRRNSAEVTMEITSHTGLSTDEFSHLQSYLFNANVDKSWEKYDSRGEGVVIAVLDDGVDINHPDLSHAIWENTDEIPGDGFDNDGNGFIDDVNGYNFRSHNNDMNPKGDHGTLVAGVIAAKANNRIGIAGIAPNAKIMPLTVCGSDNCSGQAVYEAVRYAVDNGADIINMSLTGFGDNPVFDSTYDEVMQYAYDRDVLIVVAAGNGNQELAKAQEFYGRNFDANPISPVCNDGSDNWVIGVASINSQLRNSVFSDYGRRCIDISAYGEAVYSTGVAAFSESGGEYTYAYGTSFATPQISGALALAMSEFPRKSNTELKDALLTSGFDLEPTLALEYKNHFGKGLNMIAFLDMLSGDVSSDSGSSSETPSTVTLPVGGNDSVASNDGFTDIGTRHRSYDAITYLSEQGVLEGYSDGTFQPDRTVNRAELLKILVGGQDIDPDPNRYRNCFDDVKEEWFAKYVCYAKAQGWVEGYSDGTFRPAQTVNKVEALKMMVESYSLDIDESSEGATFVDVAAGEWFTPYVMVAQNLGLLEERGALFNPSKGRTRSSISENIFRILLVRGLDIQEYDSERIDEFVMR